MRTVLRTWKTFVVVSLYVLCMAVVAAIFLVGGLGYLYSNNSGFNPQSTTSLYVLLSGFQLGLVLLIVPALTGSAISGERERQTLDLMLVTKMSSLSIILGKLCSSLMVAVLMIVASLPVYSILMFFGGLSLLDLAGTLLFTVCVAMAAGSLAMFLSVVFKKTVIAIVVTYVIILLLSIGTLIVAAVLSALYYTATRSISQLGTSNIVPMSAIMLRYATYGVLSFNPFVGFIAIMESQLGSSSGYAVSMVFGSDYMPPMSWLAINLALMLFFMLLLILRSAALLKPVRKSKKYK
jgi:ABC-type transport system involved in multi-copper enzyme maturation permease subunit